MAINHREGLSGSESVDRSHPAGDVAAHAPASGGIEEVFVVREPWRLNWRFTGLGHAA